MKTVEFEKTFLKHFKLRIQSSSRLSRQYDSRYRLFLKGERGHPLNDHALRGDKLGLRAFSVTGDVRVVYRETSQSHIFLDIGTHNQIYH